VVREENSSSPSVNPRITALKAGASGESIQIRLSDSSSFFVSPDVLNDLGLGVDMAVTEELRTALVAAAQLLAAHRKALDLLARRDHSAYELRVKLQKRGFPGEIIEKVLQQLRRLNYVNDGRFAEAWIRTRLLRRAEGPVKLKSALLQKGVAASEADRVISRFLSEDLEKINFEKALEKALVRCGGDEKKFARFLKNRGFSWKEIKNQGIPKFRKYY
jgi:regulatory protein